MNHPSRRKWIVRGLAATAGATGLAAAAHIASEHGLVPPDGGGLYGPGETLTYAVQRLLTSGALAREFPRSKISKAPFANGKPPQDELFKQHQSNSFANWKLNVGGMVAHPISFSLSELKAFPVSSQITQLACEEGWSYIAEWIGVPLSHVLKLAQPLPQAKYLVYATLPIKNATWDSIDLDEAMHPQTLISYGMNGGDLPIGFGGPLRLRVPRQLGYKSVKYITDLTVTDSLKGFGAGLGSADAEYGYSWYAGI
jgi:DMSO/TMAO reductase YedYZ molybdopterin-dependent catalytic subunit